MSDLHTSGKEEIQPTLFESDDAGTTQRVKESEENIVHACLDELNAFFEK